MCACMNEIKKRSCGGVSLRQVLGMKVSTSELKVLSQFFCGNMLQRASHVYFRRNMSLNQFVWSNVSESLWPP